MHTHIGIQGHQCSSQTPWIQSIETHARISIGYISNWIVQTKSHIILPLLGTHLFLRPCTKMEKIPILNRLQKLIGFNCELKNYSSQLIDNPLALAPSHFSTT